MANVEPKVKNATVASTVAVALVAALLSFADHHAPGLKPVLDSFVVQGALIGAVGGVATFAAGYITRHAPRALVADITGAVATAVDAPTGGVVTSSHVEWEAIPAPVATADAQPAS